MQGSILELRDPDLHQRQMPNGLSHPGTPRAVVFNHVERRGMWLAQLVEDAPLDLGFVSSRPTLGVEITEKINLKKN